jgi:hypothetical protein
VHNNASEQTPMALQCRHYLRYRPSTPLAQLNLEPLSRLQPSTVECSAGARMIS